MNDGARKYYEQKRSSLPDAADRANTAPIPSIDTIKKIHLTGICGKAMASLAGLLVKAGYIVTGSENAWNPPMSTVLEHLGIQFHPFDAENVKGVDLVVIGNALSASNVEAAACREWGVPQISSAECYKLFFIKNARSIVITGTHGKTTTASLMAHVCMNAEKSMNALVGGVVRNIGESYVYGGPEAAYSVVEGDEYDTSYFDKAPKFLHYKPTIGVITSIEFDHADIYRDMEDYLAAFLFFAQEIPPDGYVLISDAVKKEYQDKIQEVCPGKVYVYGTSEGCDITASSIEIDRQRGGQTFTITIQGTTYKDFFIPLFGTYNVANGLSVAAIALIEAFAEDAVRRGLASFKGAEQRQQILFDKNDTVVIDDFAHHPTAVKVTIDGIRDQYPNKRLIAVFEPRSATSRRKDFEQAYMEAFDKADIAIIAKPPVKSVDSANNMMSTEDVVLGIKNRGVQAFALSETVAIIEMLKSLIKQGDIVIIMSNGHFDGLSETLVQWLEKKG